MSRAEEKLNALKECMEGRLRECKEFMKLYDSICQDLDSKSAIYGFEKGCQATMMKEIAQLEIWLKGI